ncbi:HFX_2341 family transcriptional regulator domain-containing protein [Halorubrum sp. FL23]|uniref:HFX_2341 family transcriptional regulator domain-containing protein n=1 Tax=Halorubrum sp. FL23 TaxID=3458704 RepID=UPI004034F1B8
MSEFNRFADTIDSNTAIETMKNEITVSDRVHIVPLGYEKDRILEPLRELKADRVILLLHENEGHDPWYHKEVKKTLRESSLDLVERDCNIFDMYGSIERIASIVDQHTSDDVYVNLATGSKVTAIGGMIACMLTNATPYYVRAKKYGPEDEEGPPNDPVSSGVEGIDNLPSFHIDEPPAEQIRILRFVSEKGPVAKSNLSEFGKETDLPFMSNHNSKHRTGEYRLLDSHIIKPLLERDAIKVEEIGRRSEVRITDDGKNTLRAFNYLL